SEQEHHRPRQRARDVVDDLQLESQGVRARRRNSAQVCLEVRFRRADRVVARLRAERAGVSRIRLEPESALKRKRGAASKEQGARSKEQGARGGSETTLPYSRFLFLLLASSSSLLKIGALAGPEGGDQVRLPDIRTRRSPR